MRLSWLASILMLIALAPVGANASLTFAGASLPAIDVTPEASTGLDQIYVIYNTQGVTAQYQAQSDNVSWQTYGSAGGGYAQEATPTVEGRTYSLTIGNDDIGYIISDGNQRYYYWIVNYAKHAARLEGLELSAEQDCDRAKLQLEGYAGKIEYYSITGVPKELSRQMHIEYQTLEYDEENAYYRQMTAEAEIASIDGTFGLQAPLCDTRFTLCGDRFIAEWGMEQCAESQTYQAIAVEAHTWAEQEMRDSPNEQKVDTGTLGGSAPCPVEFTAVVTDAAMFREWQIARDPDFEDIMDRYQQLDFDYTFQENGTLYVRFVASNAQGSCEYYGDSYVVQIGESDLLCPNAFSPGASEGVNDEWRVSYKSIVSFECHIFNRWGQEMISFTDPAQGWDGKYKGKLVPAGVYYYVINAKGADGKRYKLSGDINIVKSRENQYSNSSSDTNQ